jgi:ring-1,2-phenylacetyl-CoA epoxidase subunit PaaC
MSLSLSENNINALKDLLYKMADDQLIVGHRNSEWTGLGPILEEDIAFSSMAQDKIGQSQHIYELLHQLGESDPDTVAFTRNANQFHNCTLVELPMGEYDFATLRHFWFDMAEAVRFNALKESSYEPLAQVAKKFAGEIKYHTMHANTWLQQLGNGTKESNDRMQSVINQHWNDALAIFEPGEYEDTLINENIFIGEEACKQQWLDMITSLIEKAGLQLPDSADWKPAYGGRKGEHTVHLQPLLSEMTEVYSIDPTADW